MPDFTREELERQRDVAIDMVVFLIDRAEATAKATGLPRPTPAETQATVDNLKEILPVLDDERPEAVFVLHAVVERLLARGRVH